MDQQQLFPAPTPAVPPTTSPCPTCGGTGQLDDHLLAQMMERPGKHNGVHTSRTAGSTPNKGTQRARVLEALWAQPDTATGLAERLGMIPSTAAARCNELHDDGFVQYLREDDGTIMELTTTPGNTGLVHSLTVGGYGVLERLDVL